MTDRWLSILPCYRRFDFASETLMTKPLFGPAAEHLGPEHDPLPEWGRQLRSASPEVLVKLLVDIAAWAQRHPRSAPALTLLGDTYLHVKQPYAAEKAFRSALAIEPNDARAREGLGLAINQIGRFDEAALQLAKAHKLAPDNAEILVHWGLCLMQLGHLKPAHKRFKMALERDVDNVQAWLNLGLVDTRRGAWDSAISHFLQALTLNPTFPPTLHNLALVYQHVGDLAQALAMATALSQLPAADSDAAVWVLLAELHINAGHISEAQQALQRAIALDPVNPNFYLTQASLFAAQRQYADAEGVLKTAQAVSRDNPNVDLKMGELHLLQGRLSSGWALLEARKRIEPSPVRRFPLPDWQGEDLRGQTILVHAEQGLGDTILFASCLPDLIERAGHVVIEVSTKLSLLVARSFPRSTVIGRDPQAMDLAWMQDISPSFHFQIPIGSLPGHFRNQPELFPSHNGYLRADPARVSFWRQKLAMFGRPTVGLTWRGGLIQTGREQRSFSLKAHAMLLRSAPVQWISLQYGTDAAQEVEVARKLGLDLPHWPETLTDQDEVAALTCALDAVVTVCSTQAHLTGALGRPGWVLTPYNPNWRYGAQGETTPWYPSLRLVRQPEPSDWRTPLTALINQIGKHLSC